MVFCDVRRNEIYLAIIWSLHGNPMFPKNITHISSFFLISTKVFIENKTRQINKVLIIISFRFVFCSNRFGLSENNRASIRCDGAALWTSYIKLQSRWHSNANNHMV